MSAFDEPVARKPFADLGRDIGNVNKYYSRGQRPAERRAAAQRAEEQATIEGNVLPAMKTNNRLRNYMRFMAPLIRDYDNLDDDSSDAVDERYAELREAGLANKLSGARANAMDRGVHDPLISREDVGLYRSLPRTAQAEAAAESDGAGRRSLNLWQEGDPEPGSNLRPDPSFDGRQYLGMQDELLEQYVGKQDQMTDAEFKPIDDYYRKGKMEGPQANQWGLMLNFGSQHQRQIDEEQDLIDAGDEETAQQSGMMRDGARRITSRLAQAEVPGAPQAYDLGDRAAKLAAFNARPGRLPEHSAALAGGGRRRKGVRFADAPQVHTFDADQEEQSPAPEVGDPAMAPQPQRPRIDRRLAGAMLFGRPDVASAMMRGEQPAPQRDYSHLAPQTRQRAGGWANPLNWGWVKRLRNWWSGSSRVQAPAEDAAPEQADAPMIDQIATMDEAEQFRPQGAAAPGLNSARRPRNPMFGKMVRRLSM